eukprot:754424-Hanusia_phi.AAC.1
MKSSQVAIVRMNRPPVNALSKSLMSDLRHTIEELEKEKQVKGLVLTSSSKVFSAGLDLVELLNPTQEFVSSFWGELQDLWIKLYSTHLVTVAAVNGAAPAAGCMLALSCDYRMMATKNVIGMNETKFGLFAPPWFVELMADTVGRRKAENLLLQGTLLTVRPSLAPMCSPMANGAADRGGAGVWYDRRDRGTRQVGGSCPRTRGEDDQVDGAGGELATI